MCARYYYVRYPYNTVRNTFYFITRDFYLLNDCVHRLPRSAPSNPFAITPDIAKLLLVMRITTHTCYMYKYNIIVSSI